MATIIYNSFWNDLAKGNIDLDTDTFKCLITTGTYSENKDTHAKRSDITNEVTGTGYTAGGNAATVVVSAIDTTNDRQEITLSVTNWTSATISNAQKFIFYKSRGGAATADELVACIDNGSGVSPSNGTLSLSTSTIRIQN